MASLNGKSYIGITVDYKKRKIKHKIDALNKHSDKIFHQEIRKFGVENVVWCILDEVSSSSVAKKIEKIYIFLFNTYYRNGYGYNMTRGGQGTEGSPRPKSDSWRQKQSQKLKGQKVGPYTKDRKRKISEGMKKYYQDNPDKKPIGSKNPMFGRLPTKESREKHSLCMKKYYQDNPDVVEMLRKKSTINSSKRWLIIHPSGKQEEIVNLTKFCIENGLSQSSMVKVSQGKQNNHKGWKCIKMN